MYLVHNYAKGYLALEGPFAYPRWMQSAESATRLSWVQANAYAIAYGGDVRAIG